MGFYYSTTTNYLYFGISVNGRCTQKAIKKPTEAGFSLISNARAFHVHFLVLMLPVSSPTGFANFLFLNLLSYH